jgi:hypothetical protein
MGRAGVSLSPQAFKFHHETSAVETENLTITVLMNTGSGSEDKSAARTAIDATLRDCGRNVEFLSPTARLSVPCLRLIASIETKMGRGG